MKAKLIKTEKEHEAALAHIDALMDAPPGSEAEAELELWAMLVEQYEREHFPVEDPDPIEAIKFRMDQLGLQQKDLIKYLGAKSKVSEVLNRKRQLSLPMIRGLTEKLGIPAEVLVRKAKLAGTRTPGGKSRVAAAKRPVEKAASKRPKTKMKSGKREVTPA